MHILLLRYSAVPTFIKHLAIKNKKTTMRIKIKFGRPKPKSESRKRSLDAPEVDLQGQFRAHKQKRLCNETHQEHESWSFRETHESFMASKECSLDNVQLRKKTEERVIKIKFSQPKSKSESRKRSLDAPEVDLQGQFRAHKQKRLCKETHQEYESWSFRETHESFMASKECSPDNVQVRKKTEERVAALKRRFEATILRATLKKMDCDKWEAKMRNDREKLVREEAEVKEGGEEEASQAMTETALEKEDSALPVYFITNNKSLVF